MRYKIDRSKLTNYALPTFKIPACYTPKIYTITIEQLLPKEAIIDMNEIIQYSKEELARKIVDALIEQGIIKFTIRDEYGVYKHRAALNTVGDLYGTI